MIINPLRIAMLAAVVTASLATPALANNCGQLCSHEWIGTASPNMVRERIAAGDHINGRNAQGETPLTTVAGWGGERLSVAEAMLNAGASVNMTRPDGLSPLHIALMVERTDRSIVRLMLERGANPNARAQSVGITPLHIVGLTGKDPYVIQLLMQSGANAGYVTSAHDNPLHMLAAADNRSKEIVMALVDAGVNINGRNKLTSSTPLHMAVANDAHPVILMNLIEAGADVNAAATEGMTPLHLAAAIGTSYRNIELLVQAGADINLRNTQGQTALELARQNPALAQHFR